MKSTLIITIARLLAGVIFTFAGLNGFGFILGFEPIGPNSLHVPLMQVLLSTPYFAVLLKSVELIAGLPLLLNRWAPLASLLLLPIGVNIFLFHLFADPGLIIVGAIVMVLLVSLLVNYRKHYEGILKQN